MRMMGILNNDDVFHDSRSACLSSFLFCVMIMCVDIAWKTTNASIYHHCGHEKVCDA